MCTTFFWKVHVKSCQEQFPVVYRCLQKTHTYTPNNKTQPWSIWFFMTLLQRKKQTKTMFLKYSTSLPVAGGCVCFADASSLQCLLMSLEGTVGSILLCLFFFSRRHRLSSLYVGRDLLYKLGNIYLCSRELYRLHGHQDLSITMKDGRAQLDVEGWHCLTS